MIASDSMILNRYPKLIAYLKYDILPLYVFSVVQYCSAPIYDPNPFSSRNILIIFIEYAQIPKSLFDRIRIIKIEDKKKTALFNILELKICSAPLFIEFLRIAFIEIFLN